MEITGQLTEYVLAIVIMILCLAVLFYAKDGYHQIGNAKFAAYRTVMIYGFAVLLVLVALYMVFWLCEHGKPMLSVTDKFVLAYLVLTGISVISGGFYDNVLWGCSGWNMGLMSQVSFVLLYFFYPGLADITACSLRFCAGRRPSFTESAFCTGL